MSERVITLEEGEELIIRKSVKIDYSFAEFCRITGISRSKLYRLRKDGKIIADGKKISHSEVSKLNK